MNVGSQFTMSNYDLLQPLEGKLVDVTLQGGEQVKARVIDVGSTVSTLKIVPSTLKE